MCVCVLFLFAELAILRLCSAVLIHHCFVPEKCLPGLSLLNKRYQAMESSSHVHHCFVDLNDGKMYFSVGWIAVEKKLEKTGKENVMRVAASKECAFAAKQCGKFTEIRLI